MAAPQHANTASPVLEPESSKQQLADLREYATLVRHSMLEMYDGLGCLSGGFSSVELYVAFYLGYADCDLITANSELRTRVLAKGTASLAVYATLAAAGVIAQEDLQHYGTHRLPPMYRADMTGIDATHYTLGPSLGTSVGMALAAKLKSIPFDVVCFIGDGELQEGVDQAAKSAVSFGLGNLAVVVDCNALQSYYATAVGDPTMAEDADGQLAQQRDFWQACGWRVTEIDGHDLAAVLAALRGIGRDDTPYIILARTLKGKGIPEIEGELGYQHRMSAAQMESARQFYAEQSSDLRVRPRAATPQPKCLPFPSLDAPRGPVRGDTPRQTLAAWIKRLKAANPGLVYSVDSDCRNVFSPECTARVVSRDNYQSQHIFPGLNERLTLTIAKGLAYEGLCSVVGCRANNLTDTSEEWNAVCADQLPVLLAGTRPGAIQADWAPTKCSFMDIEIMGRHGCQIYQPANSTDLVWLLTHVFQNPRKHLPSYLRVPDFESDCPMHAQDDPDSWRNGYYIGAGQEHCGDFTAILATGDSLQAVLELCELYGALEKIKLFNLFNLTHIDAVSLRRALSGATRIVSVIEARSSAISEILFVAMNAEQRAIYEPLGINSAPPVIDKRVFRERGFYGAREEALRSAGLDASSLANRLGFGN